MPRPLSEWIDELLPDLRTSDSVVFRVDAGRVYGLSFGHLERCLIVARVLRGKGCTCRFVMRDYPKGPGWAEASGFEVHRLAWGISQEAEWKEVERLVLSTKSRYIVVDLPYPDIDLDRISDLQRNAARVVYIDDNRFRTPQVHRYLNSSILASQDKVRGRAEYTRTFTGPEWLILEDGFFDYRNKAAAANDNIVLTFGGSDPTGLLPKVLGELATKHVRKTWFKCVLGPGYKKDSAGLPGLENDIFDFIKCPDDLISILAGCRAAICAGGRTMYELWALEKPFLPIGSAKHESETIAAFKRNGLCSLGMEAWNEIEFGDQFKTLIGD